MTLSVANQNLGNLPEHQPGQNGASGGYSPDTAHPLILRPDLEPGKYDSYLRTVRHMVDPEIRTLSAYVRGGHYRTDIQRALAHRYYYLTQRQIRSESSMMNHRRIELFKEKSWIESLLAGLNQTIDLAQVRAYDDAEKQELRNTTLNYDWATLVNPDKRPLTAILPVTLAEAYQRLEEILVLVQSLAQRIQRAQQLDIYYDVGPLLAYWQTPFDQRGDLDPTLGPAFMVRLNDIVDICSAYIWRHQAQRIISQTADGEGESPLETIEEPKPKRSMLGRIMKR